jgi:hypothetical protein
MRRKGVCIRMIRPADLVYNLENRPFGYDAVYFGTLVLTFRKNLLHLFLYLVDGHNMFLRNVSTSLANYTACPTPPNRILNMHRRQNLKSNICMSTIVKM